MKELYYPIALKLKDRTAVVVGGGRVAERKVKTLLEVGVRVCVVSPDLTIALQRFFKSHRIIWINRGVRCSDVNKKDIVIAATSDPAINKKVSRWAKRQGILVNVVDMPKLSSFISPALLRLSKAAIAVYTDARDPVLSRDLKNFLKENWNVFLSYRRGLQKRSA